MTWNELKEFCNSLNEDQLSKNVILWRESEEITNIHATQIDEDFYINSGDCDDGCIPEWQVNNMIKDEPEAFPDGMDDFEKVYEKGHPILWEEF